MPAGRRLVTRRATLALGAAGMAVVAGCDLDGDPSPTDPDPTGPDPTDAGRTPPADPDEALVEEVLTDLGALTGLVAAVGGRFPRLAPAMADLRALHEAHTEALEGTPTTAGGAPAPTTAAAALQVVRRHEQRLRSRLVGAAVAAESGALARLLASMSAAVSQHIATLPGDVA